MADQGVRSRGPDPFNLDKPVGVVSDALWEAFQEISWGESIESDPLLSHKLPLPLGEGWGEGVRFDKSLFDKPPHPRIKSGAGSNLLPEGEGTKA